jgi:hypothetical protein
LILRGFKSNEFVCADSARLTDAFCVSAHSKELSPQERGTRGANVWGTPKKGMAASLRAVSTTRNLSMFYFTARVNKIGSFAMDQVEIRE